MREDIVKHIKSDSLLMSTLKSDDRVEQIRRLRNQKIQDQELQTYEGLLEVCGFIHATLVRIF